jgi:hypothetical protein
MRISEAHDWLIWFVSEEKNENPFSLASKYVYHFRDRYVKVSTIDCSLTSGNNIDIMISYLLYICNDYISSTSLPLSFPLPA